jgi:hypothetical protein
VGHRPNSRGSIRHWQPLRAKYISPLTITRRSQGGRVAAATAMSPGNAGRL